MLAKTVQLYAKRYPKLADWLEANVPQGLTGFACPEPQRQLIRTTTGAGAQGNQAPHARRRQLSKRDALFAAVTALATACSDERETGKVYSALPPTL